MTPARPLEDDWILRVTADHPEFGQLGWRRVIEDRQVLYALTINGRWRKGGTVWTYPYVCSTIARWKELGWIQGTAHL